MTLVLGLDAGSTKTSAVILDEEGRALGRGLGGPGNYHSAGAPGTLSAIRAATSGALSAACLTPDQLAAACFALSGVDRPADRAVAVGFARDALPGVPTVICNDAVAAIYAGVGKAEGVVVIAGTGSIIYGFAPDGTTARAGGWGYHLGDEGSGWSIAEQSLLAITRAHDGSAPQTMLTSLYLSQLGLSVPEDLITWAYGPEWTRDHVAALAVLTLQAAERGDVIAVQLIRQAAAALAAGVRVVARKLALDVAPFNVVQVGGLFGSAFYRDALRCALAASSPNARPLIPPVDAAAGAARVALDSLRGQGMSWIR